MTSNFDETGEMYALKAIMSNSAEIHRRQGINWLESFKE